MSSDRTEKASPRRRQKAEQEGDRPRSRELLSAVALLGGSLTLGWSTRAWIPVWNATYQHTMALIRASDLNADAISTSARGILVVGATPCIFVMLAAATASLGIAMAQNRGFQLRPAAIAPKLARLNPAENAKNLFTTRALVRLGKSLVPVCVLAVQLIHFLTTLSQMPVFSLARLPEVFAEAYELLVNTAWIMLAWSLVDYIVEWRQWEGRLKMSKQEMREEFKEMEGNPQMKGRIRSLQRQMRRRTLRADVKKASVVITNPTHYAVALSFDMNTMEAPKVLAKGRDLFAARIREEARWAGVPLVENPPLARSLYRAVEPGQSIPADLYAAVAAILAYLFRQESEERMRRMHEQRSREEQRASNSGNPVAPSSNRSAGSPLPSAAIQETR